MTQTPRNIRLRKISAPWLLGFVTVTLVLTACGSGGGDSASSKKSSSPLADMLGYGGSQAEQRAQAEKQQGIAQEKIAACMRAEGFKYVSFSNLNFSSFSFGPPEGGEVAYKRKNGYGMADNMETSFAPQATQAKDPNEAIRAALSKSERAAYEKVLYGFDTSGPPPGDPANFQPVGCQSKAFGGDELQAAFKPLETKFADLQRRTTSDPRSVKILSAWTGCMKKAGYALKDQQSVYEYLSPEQTKIFSPQAGTGDTIVVAGADGGSALAPQIDKAKVAAFRKVELKLANADADCMSQDKVNELRDISREYERAFVDENRALLEKVKALNNP